MTRKLLAVLGAMFWLQGLPVRADTTQADRDRLVLIYKISILQEVCGFELTDQQASALGTVSDKLEGELEISEDDAQKLYDETFVALEADKGKGLCDSKGEWASAYKQGLETLVSK